LGQRFLLPIPQRPRILVVKPVRFPTIPPPSISFRAGRTPPLSELLFPLKSMIKRLIPFFLVLIHAMTAPHARPPLFFANSSSCFRNRRLPEHPLTLPPALNSFPKINGTPVLYRTFYPPPPPPASANSFFFNIFALLAGKSRKCSWPRISNLFPSASLTVPPRIYAIDPRSTPGELEHIVFPSPLGAFLFSSFFQSLSQTPETRSPPLGVLATSSGARPLPSRDFSAFCCVVPPSLSILKRSN